MSASLPCKACGCALADCDAYGEGCCPSCQRDTMHEPTGVHTCTNPALCPLDLVEYHDLFTGELVTAPRSQVKLGGPPVSDEAKIRTIIANECELEVMADHILAALAFHGYQIVPTPLVDWRRIQADCEYGRIYGCHANDERTCCAPLTGGSTPTAGKATDESAHSDQRGEPS